MTPDRTPVGGALPTRHRDGGPWEEMAGYSRAARAGTFLAVSGTTAPHGAELLPGDTYGQTVAAIGRIIAAVQVFGGTEFDIIRTRIMLVPLADVDGACRAHQELLGQVAPANSLYFVAGLIGDGLLVEVEADAVLGSGAER